MSDYNKTFSSRDELMKALEESVKEIKNDDGTSSFSFQNDFADKYYAEIQNAKKQRQEKQDAVNKANALQAELDGFRSINPNSSTPSTPQGYLDTLKTFEEKLAVMERENKEFRERETKTKINAKLKEIAEEVGISRNALKDVAAIYGSKFRLTEDGKLREVGTDVDATEIMRNALNERPYWNQKSRGGGASSNVGGFQDSRSKSFEAMKRGDFADAFYNAPSLEQ